jgi:hypothetical protein
MMISAVPRGTLQFEGLASCWATVMLHCCCLQLKFILGYNVPRADKLYEQIHLYIEGIDGFVWQEYVMGVTLLT